MAEGRNRKRLIKAARKISVERILDVLRMGDDELGGSFLVDDPICPRICCWSRTSGLMMMLIEDDALALACEEYMKSHGYLVFDSEEKATGHFHSRCASPMAVAPPGSPRDATSESN